MQTIAVLKTNLPLRAQRIFDLYLQIINHSKFLNNYFKMRPMTPIQNSRPYKLRHAKNSVKPVRIIEDIDDICLEQQNQSLIECNSRSNLNIMRSYKDLKQKCVADILVKSEFLKLTNNVKNSNANPHEGRKSKYKDSDRERM